MKYQKKAIWLLVIGALLCTTAVYSRGKWDKYYKNKLYLPPCSLLLKSLQCFPFEGQAIDLGCGVGNETAFLLNRGWNVWAIDSQSKAIRLLRARNDIDAWFRLNTRRCSFESCEWHKLPRVDLIFAGLSLPFCRPERFKTVWWNLCNQLNENGRFVGHFFGINYRGFTEANTMMFLTCDQVLSLFDGFEIEYFEEWESDDISGTGQRIHSHIFEVIARKKCGDHFREY